VGYWGCGGDRLGVESWGVGGNGGGGVGGGDLIRWRKGGGMEEKEGGWQGLP